MGGGISMFTSNYWNYKVFIESRSIGNGVEWTRTDIGLKGLDGNTVLFLLQRSDSAAQYYYVYGTLGIRSGLGIVVGTGTSDPDITDYALSTDITSSLINTSVSSSTGIDGAGIKTVLSFTGTNNTGSDITITEYGITKAVNIGNSVTTPVLITHELLSNPLVVPTGSSFVLSVEWKDT